MSEVPALCTSLPHQLGARLLSRMTPEQLEHLLRRLEDEVGDSFAVHVERTRGQRRIDSIYAEPARRPVRRVG